ncbi:MAG: MBL fold metallo-hydrolase [Pseudomonadota bacterium]
MSLAVRSLMHRFLIAATALLMAPALAHASRCVALAENVPPYKALIQYASLQPEEVRITYVGHSSYRIETADGLSIVTDYAGNAGPGPVPTVVTMNRAHSSHWTQFPDPAITHVLKGWGEGEEAKAEHYLELDNEVLIRNVTTDIRGSWDTPGRVVDGNSIFIFEVAGLCIGHLGHLHHELSPGHIGAIGRIDILMIPVDGTYTMNQDNMLRVAKELRSSIVLPMHWFGLSNLERFVAGMATEFGVNRLPERDFTVTLNTLPPTPQVFVPGGFLSFPSD